MAKLRAVGCREFIKAVVEKADEMAQYARAKVGWAQESSDEPSPSVKAHINELYAKSGITGHKF